MRNSNSVATKLSDARCNALQAVADRKALLSGTGRIAGHPGSSLGLKSSPPTTDARAVNVRGRKAQNRAVHGPFHGRLLADRQKKLYD